MKPTIGRVVWYYPAGPIALRQDAEYSFYQPPSVCDRPLRADVIDTLAESSKTLSGEMHVHLDVSGSMAFAPFIARDVPFSEAPTPGTHRWCYPSRSA